MHLVGDGEELLEQPHNEVIAGHSLLLVVVRKHLGARVEQEQTEESQNPLKTFHHGSTRKDEDAAQHQGAEDAPEEHLVLVFPLDAEE